ncbi:MAG: hypothetical protein Q8M66_02320 [Actinomycetota bacterium]|nr:hypothetical protein [Actinomycetota bacterium]
MKNTLLVLFLLIACFANGQEYGAESYWERKEREKQNPPKNIKVMTSGDYLEKAGNQLLTSDLLVFAAVIIPTAAWAHDHDFFKPQQLEGGKEFHPSVVVYGVCSGLLTSSVIVRICGYNNIRRAGKISTSAQIRISPIGLSLAMKF